MPAPGQLSHQEGVEHFLHLADDLSAKGRRGRMRSHLGSVIGVKVPSTCIRAPMKLKDRAFPPQARSIRSVAQAPAALPLQLTGRQLAHIGPAILAAELYAARQGVDFIRTHDVAAIGDALTVSEALNAIKKTP